MENGDKIEEGLWNSFPEQRRVDRHRRTVPLYWLGLDGNLHKVQLIRQCLPDGFIGILGDWC